ncbi:helix-turn-helix domain-containing protein [Paenibacillus sp. M2]|uniref:helix-turn-helix domain-containing protein n=1 Tax=Paenibacillus sp. M2 TaxID=3341793 RepID=UPI00398A352D
MYVLNITAVDENKISLAEARDRKGMTIVEASSALNISAEELVTYELDSSDMGFKLATKLGELYGLPLHKMDFSE